MAREVDGKLQNTLTLTANEVTNVTFHARRGIEIYNVSGGTVWAKWTDGTVAINGPESTPIPVGVAYVREDIKQPIFNAEDFIVQLIAEANSVVVLNCL